jgi:hypothetical protein
MTYIIGLSNGFLQDSFGQRGGLSGHASVTIRAFALVSQPHTRHLPTLQSEHSEQMRNRSL